MYLQVLIVSIVIVAAIVGIFFMAYFNKKRVPRCGISGYKQGSGVSCNVCGVNDIDDCKMDGADA